MVGWRCYLLEEGLYIIPWIYKSQQKPEFNVSAMARIPQYLQFNGAISDAVFAEVKCIFENFTDPTYFLFVKFKFSLPLTIIHFYRFRHRTSTYFRNFTEIKMGPFNWCFLSINTCYTVRFFNNPCTSLLKSAHKKLRNRQL